MNTLYTRAGCPACSQAKEILAQQGLDYVEVEKKDGVVPILVGKDTGDSYVLMKQGEALRFVKAAVHA